MDLIEFRHAIFQDFLAARQIFQKHHLKHLLDNAHDPLYHDVAIMAAGQVQGDMERLNQLLDGLIDRSRAGGRNERQLKLLAAACIADLALVDRSRVLTIRKATKELLPPRTADEAESVAAVGEFVLDLLADVLRKRQLTQQEAVATVAAIAAIDVDDATSAGMLRTLAPTAGSDSLVGIWHRSNRPRTYAEQVLSVLGPFDDRVLRINAPELIPHLTALSGVHDLALYFGAVSSPSGRSALTHLSGLAGLRSLHVHMSRFTERDAAALPSGSNDSTSAARATSTPAFSQPWAPFTRWGSPPHA